MYCDRVFTICPFLTGSADGGVCGAKTMLLRNLEDIDPDMCMSRHFEVCPIYIETLQELDVLGVKARGKPNASCNNIVTMFS